jgi:hypothetical protein
MAEIAFADPSRALHCVRCVHLQIQIHAFAIIYSWVAGPSAELQLGGQALGYDRWCATHDKPVPEWEALV